MKERFYLKDGGSFIANDEGYEITTESGYLTKLNKDGEFISREKLEEQNPGFEHFFAMDKEELDLVWNWYHWSWMPGLSENEKRFLNRVEKALQNINDVYYIATIEPSIDRMGKLYYKPGDPVATKLKLGEWDEKVGEYCPSRNSRIAKSEELYLWYAYRVARNYWTLKYLCDAPIHFNELEVSAKKKIGGFADGITNTRKFVRGHYGYEWFGYSRRGDVPAAGGSDFIGESWDYEISLGRGSVVVVLER